MMNAASYQLLLPNLAAVPWGQKKPQLAAVFDTSRRHHRRRRLGLAAPKAQLTTASANDDKFRGTVKPWYSLLGMSLADVHKEFPDTMANVFGDSLDTLRNKDRETDQGGWSVDAGFDSGFAESIVFDKELYKYGIMGCKTNVDRIMNGGAISACDRDKIIRCLESIEGDIEQGKFKWKEGADVYTNIVEALLADKLGDIPKDLVITDKCDSCLLILEMWCKSYIDQIKTRMNQLQVAIVLFALRIECLIHRGRHVQDTKLLESLVLPSLKTLEHDASDLRAFLSIDGVISLRNRFPDEFSLSKRSTIADFARSINYCIPDHLVQLLKKFISSRHLISIRPHGEPIKDWEMLQKIIEGEHMRERGHRHLALSKCLNTGVSESPRDCEIQDGKYHLFSSAKVVLEMIDMSIKCVENMSIGLKKLQVPHPRGYDDVMGFAYFLTSKD
ncbi:unnamed protein product [Alopecurus aequalis]